MSAVFTHSGAQVAVTREYSRYARLLESGPWDAQEVGTLLPLSARLPSPATTDLPKQRRGSEPSSHSRPSRSELFGTDSPRRERPQHVQRSATLGRNSRRPDEILLGYAIASDSSTPSPNKRYAVFIDDQRPLLEAASLFSAPTPPPTAVSDLLFHVPSPGGSAEEEPHDKATAELPWTPATAPSSQYDGSSESEGAAESPERIYFTIHPAWEPDDGGVTLIFTDRPSWL